jgi:hypothetical protein
MKKLGAGDAAVAQTAVEFLTGVEPKSSIDGTAPDRAPAMLQYHPSVRPGREIMEDGNAPRTICPVDAYLRYFGGAAPN